MSERRGHELDTEALQEELETIKNAMDIGERYPSQLRLWPVYGVLVGLAALGSQAIVSFDLPGWGHWLSWGTFMSLGGVYQAVGTDREATPARTEAKPSLGVGYGAPFVYAVVVILIVAPLLTDAAPAVTSSTVFALMIGAVGLAYLTLGNSLRAFYIRRRDRYAFYIAGGWMLGLAVLVPRLAFLRRWGYGVFGLAFGVYAVAAYLYLR